MFVCLDARHLFELYFVTIQRKDSYDIISFAIVFFQCTQHWCNQLPKTIWSRKGKFLPCTEKGVWQTGRPKHMKVGCIIRYSVCGPISICCLFQALEKSCPFCSNRFRCFQKKYQNLVSVLEFCQKRKSKITLVKYIYKNNCQLIQGKILFDLIFLCNCFLPIEIREIWDSYKAFN